MQAEEKKELETVLTSDQKKRLIEILTGVKEPEKPKDK